LKTKAVFITTGAHNSVQVGFEEVKNEGLNLIQTTVQEHLLESHDLELKQNEETGEITLAIDADKGDDWFGIILLPYVAPGSVIVVNLDFLIEYQIFEKGLEHEQFLELFVGEPELTEASTSLHYDLEEWEDTEIGTQMFKITVK
jgi:hypothetical protein